ncbi:MAG TPA: AAA family ATPase [Actinocrinis sp.]|nr:AAA family ATPase [Actinocrinis sp.]
MSSADLRKPTFSSPGCESSLVGRDDELSLAGRSLAALADGRGGILWIEGEPGIGKSALAAEVERRATTIGVDILRGSGDALLQPFPLRLMAACLGVPGRGEQATGPDATALSEIAELLGGRQPRADVADPVLAAAERMLDLIDRRCARGPVLLTVENLQWADHFSLQVWNRLAYAVDQVPLLLVGVLRPGPSRPAVERLRATALGLGGVLVRPGPLSDRAAVQFAAQVIGAAPGPRLRVELARAAGNPRYLNELLRALAEAGLIAARDGVAEFDGAAGVTPGSLTAAIGRRLDFLDPQTLDALRTAALLGTEFDAGQAAVAAGLPVLLLAHAMAQAKAAGIVVAGGERMAFRHELVQQVLVEQFAPPARRVQRARIAQLLAQGGAGVEAVAAQLMADSAVPGALAGLDEPAGPSGLVGPAGPRRPAGLDDWAVDWLAGLPLYALYAALEVSAELLTRAVRPLEPGTLRWDALAGRLAQVLLLLGQDDDLIEFASVAAGLTGDPVLAAQLRLTVVRAAGRNGRPGFAVDMARQALAQPDLPLRLRARLEAWQSVAHTVAGESPEGREAAHRALTEARTSQDPLAVAYAHHATALCATTAEGIGHIDEALSMLGSDAESTDIRVLFTHDRLIRLAQLGRIPEYEAALPAALMLAERVGTPRATSLFGAAAQVAFRRGDWDATRRHLKNVDPAYLSAPGGFHLHGLGAIEALHRADRTRATAHLAAVEAVIGPGLKTAVPRAVYIFEARALLAEAEGEPARALALLATWLDTPPGLRRDERLDEAPTLVRLALAEGEPDVARQALEMIEAAARAEPLILRLTAARFCRAQIKDDVAELTAIAEIYQTQGWPLHAGAAWEETAVRLARVGEVVPARGTLTRAVRTYADLGAEWDVRRADGRLRALGVRRGPRSAHSREKTGWGALTASEAHIARLVGAGWSNPDIAAELSLSLRTVQTHVSNILAKLQLHSRLDVVRAIAGTDAAGAEPPVRVSRLDLPI